MRFSTIFVFYSCVLSLLVGIVAGTFLTITNVLTNILWASIPQKIALPIYPVIVGIIGGILVGIIQTRIGNYPTTMHDTLKDFKQTGRVTYRNQIAKNFFSAIVVLTFGASLGPEAALAGILGGLITWVGDHLKMTIQRKEALLKLSLGTMLAAVFRAPLAGVGEVMERGERKKTIGTKKLQRIALYAVSTGFGLIGFLAIKHLFPEESTFSLRISDGIVWKWEVVLFAPIAWIVGGLFGVLFLKLETFTDKLAARLANPMLAAIIAGILLGLFAMCSPYFLFSGEHQLLPFSRNALEQPLASLLLLGIGKAFLTNLCFSFGWRGGKIFPAIFSSTAVGFATVKFCSYMPGLLLGILVAASITIILEKPYVSTALLIFLFPLQFFPVILVSSLGIDAVRRRMKRVKN